MIVRAMNLIGIVADHTDGMEAINAHTTANAMSGIVTHDPKAFYPFQHILRTLIQVGKAVYLLVGQGGDGGHQVFIFRVISIIEGSGQSIDPGQNLGIFPKLLDLLAPHEDSGVHMAKVFQVLLPLSHGSLQA